MNLSESKRDERNPMWKGDSVGKKAIHEWVRSRLLKPEVCSSCRLRPPIDLANISQEYRRDLMDWEWLCRRCHMQKDGRLNNLIPNPNLVKNCRCGRPIVSRKLGVCRQSYNFIKHGSGKPCEADIAFAESWLRETKPEIFKA